MNTTLHRICIAVAAIVCISATLEAQQAFELDTTFRCEPEVQNVIDALVLSDGDVVISGGIRVEGDPAGFLRGGVRLNPDGTLDPDFPELIYMGAHLVPWQDKLYAGGNPVSRLFMDSFTPDPTWELLDEPLLLPFQYGQYHVFPDGRVLLGGLHDLLDTAHGFVGSYELVWLTNTGRLDTTRVHRNANGAIYRFKQVPLGSNAQQAGKFMCFGFGTQFEGHPVPRVFRVLADGQWDSSFVAPLAPFQGYALDFEFLPDGRIYSAGRFSVTNNPDTLHVVRFMPDGSLDPTFNQSIAFTQTPSVTPGGALLGGVHVISENRILVFGNFDRVDGQFHRGICMIDSIGNVLHEFFQGDGCGITNYNGSQGNSIEGVAPLGNGDWYVWGAYAGYDDGTINDPQQRLISRLHEPDTGLSAMEQQQAIGGLRIYPNPNSGYFTLNVDEVNPNALVTVRDALGREVLRQYLGSYESRLTLTTAGVYMLELLVGNDRRSVLRVVVE